MNKLIREYFSFSTTERNGIIVLFIILIVVIISPYFIKLLHKDDSIDYKKIENEIKAFQIREKTLKQKNNSNNGLANIQPFQFNPNKISKKKLEKLGLDKHVIRNIVNYRKKGGVFSKREDFKKIYGVDEEIYAVLEHYINIDIIETKKNEIIINPFDPNTITHQEWKQIGVDDKIINIIQNYLSAGGRFFKKDDLKKIYGIKQELYEKLEPFIVIDTTVLALKQKSNNDSISLTYNIIELNSTDSIVLNNIFSNKSLVSRIIKYRSFLGGYYLTEQLLEVYGFKDVKAIDQFITDTSIIKKININKAEFKELVKHPYISYDETKAIFTYRKVMGNFNSVDDIRKYKLISSDTYKKIRPYLSID